MRTIRNAAHSDDVMHVVAAIGRLDDLNPLVFDELSFAVRGNSLLLEAPHAPSGGASTHAGFGATDQSPSSLPQIDHESSTAQWIVLSTAPGEASAPVLAAAYAREPLDLPTSNAAPLDLVRASPFSAAQSGVERIAANGSLGPFGGAFAAPDSHQVERAATSQATASAASGTDATEQEASVLLDASAHFNEWKFTNDLPIAARMEADRPGTYVLEMKQSEQWLGLRDEGGDLVTTIWGYGLPGQDATYPGPTIVAHEGQPIQLNWKNMLPVDGHLLPVDTSIGHADGVRMTLEEGHVPTVVHLHGGHTASGSDGLPEAWFTQHNAEVGPAYVQRILEYENDQQAATLWYHDHALGLTRLNVYSGLAGFFLLRDDAEQKLIDDGVLPGGKYEIEMAIQDRAFLSDGQLYLPAYAEDPIPGTTDTLKDTMPEDPDDPDVGFHSYPTAVPEFFGDFILVNGMAWPKLDVDAGEYRFRMLDGSDSRFYVMELDNPNVKVTLVGSDGGLLNNAITVMDGDGIQEAGERLIIAPGDRLDMVVDFSNLDAGDKVTLLNFGPAYEPFKGLNEDGSLAGEAESAQGSPVGQIMQFVVGDGASFDVSITDGMALNTNYTPLTMDDIANSRMLGLFEGSDELGRILPQLGVAQESIDENGDTVAFGPLAFDAPTTERPALGDTESWQIFNFTADAHPIHLHLVQFDLLERNRISFEDADENGMPDDVTLDGQITVGKMSEQGVVRYDDVLIDDENPIALFPTDQGAQDTSWVGPGEMVNIAATFDKPGEYVWHCHILSHEDHDMMRPFEVIDKAPLG
jgi:spore coat protein A, manganese oxidase